MKEQLEKDAIAAYIWSMVGDAGQGSEENWKHFLVNMQIDVNDGHTELQPVLDYLKGATDPTK